VARTRLIVGLITPHRIYLIIMKPVREAKARSRAVLCMYVHSPERMDKKHDNKSPSVGFTWVGQSVGSYTSHSNIFPYQDPVL
jgi:hypothetical protein